MKLNRVIFLVVMFLANYAIAQSSRSSVSYRSDSIASQGFRLALLKPVLKWEVKASADGQSASANGDIDDAIGVSMGYASLPSEGIGWVANMAYLTMKDGGTSNFLRLDGSAAISMNDSLNFKAGLNLSDITSGGSSETIDTGIGFQTGIGIQFNQTIGLDIGYTQMNQRGSQDGVSVDLKETGMELGLNATF